MPDVCRIARLVGIAVLVQLGPVLAQPGPTGDSFGGPGVISVAASGATSGLDRQNITISGSKLILPVIASAETSDYGKLYTVLEIANITDSDADYSLRFLGADGTALSMPIQGSCPTCVVSAASQQAMVGAHGGGRIVVLSQNPLKIGWAEFTADPAASISVSAMLYAEDSDGSVGRAGIPPTSTYKRAWLYTDNTSDFTTRVVLVNPSATGQRTYQLQYRDSSDTSSTCQASIQIAALGQVLIETAESLACSSGDRGMVEISGDHGFTGIAIVSHGGDGSIFTRQLVALSALGDEHPRLEQWTITTGSVTYGGTTSAGCIAVSNTSMNGVVHTVHTSKWQKRADQDSAWTDIPNTSRNGLVCANSNSANEDGQYRGLADITIGGERGTYATKNVLTVGSAPGTTDSQPSFATTVGNQSYQAGTAISPLTLPAASDGDGSLAYSLSPGVPGLSFNSATRVFAGTPTAAGTYNMTYTVRDADGDIATLNFVVTVATTQMTTIDLVVASVTASDDTPAPAQSFDLTATTSNRGTAASAATTLRFYRSTNTTISSSDTEVGTAAVGALAAGGTSSSVLTLDAPATAGTYYYGACVDTVSGESNSRNNCSTAVTVTVGGSQMEIADFDLASDNVRPEGIVFASNRFLVVDSSDDKVYAYQASGARDAASDFDLTATNGNATGITFANNKFYVVDSSDDKVYAYSAAGQREPAADFDLHADNADPNGITFANNRFFVVDAVDDKVYAYTATGQPEPAANFDLHADNAWQAGITFANNRFLMPDATDRKVYAYSAAGQREPAADFDLHADNGWPRGVTVANNTVCIVDSVDDKVYAYPVEAAPGTTDSQPSFGAATVGGQSYQAGTAISPLTLPAASGGDGTLTYSLSPTVPGLSFNTATRALSGTPTAAGMYSMTYTVRDADGDIATLNFSVTVATAQMTTVDLAVASVTASDTTPATGQSVDLTATTNNRGTGGSAATTLRFYRSTNTTISSSDTQVGTATVSALAAGGSSASVLTLTAPSTAGTYYYGACVDTVPGESSTQNNCSSAVSVTVSASQTGVQSFDLASVNGGPEGITFANNKFYVVDYIDEEVYAYQASGARDSASDFDLDSANGNATGITFANNKFYVVDDVDDKVYVYQASGARDSASDFDLDSANGSPEGITFANNKFYVVDDLDAKVYVHQASGARDSASDFDLDSANGSATGITFTNNKFYVVDDIDNWVYAYNASGPRDPASDIYLHPANDWATGITFASGMVCLVDRIDDRVYVTAATQSPDLVISTPSASPSTPVTGDSFEFRATVRNRGTGTASATTLRYYRSTNRTISTSDTQVGTDSIPALARAGTSAETITLTAPSTAGTYYYGACVGSVSEEPYTHNNCSSSRRVTVRARVPDLVVESPSVSDSTPGSEGSFVFTTTVRNRGTKASAATTLRYYRSDDRTISTSDTQVGTDAVGALAVDGTSSQTMTLTAPTTAGTYYYGACVDLVAEESSTTNNCSIAVAVFGGGPFPAYDLVISSATLHTAGVFFVGESIHMSVTVANRGPNRSQPANLRFGNSTYRDIPALDSGATTTISRVRVGSAFFGTSTYRACIVEAPGEENTSNNCTSRSVTFRSF